MATKQDRPRQGDAETKPTVVGIGASAGGLAALRQLFEHIPADSGIAFVVVVHLSPEHKSLLADLLQPCVRFPVQQVTETVPLKVNNVYVIPPNANLSAIDTHLRLSALEEKRAERAPIDHFFRTMATTYDGHSIGVVLTGTGSDGTLGLREIKAKGGVILVQDPNEAEFDGMPQSAISTGLVDRVLPIEEIAVALLRLAQAARSLDVRKTPEGVLEVDRALLPKLLAILRARTERDFSRYKSATLLRRIGRRMQLHYIESFSEYVEIVRDQADEARALADDLLINVTSFFRDADVFSKLETRIVPKIFEHKGAGDSVRVWSVGCATGEEAYSLAMLLIEEKSRRAESPKIQIFASDLHRRSLDSAREGLYPGDIETDVSAARLQRFFQRENGGYRISKEVRDMVVFAPHNLLGDPPFSKLDLISCRNLLIYLDRSVQRDVTDLFHYALCPGGFLLLGSAETIDASELFRTDDKKLCIYEKRNVPAPEPKLPVFPLMRAGRAGESSSRPEYLPSVVPFRSVHQNMLERFAPPSILVGLDNRVVHLSENVGRYLMIPGGEISASVLRLVREELRVALQLLLQTARETRQPADSGTILVRFDGVTAPVVMRVRPAVDPDQEDFVLVMFEEHQPIATDVAGEKLPRSLSQGDADNDARVADLERELRGGRQQLQTVIEEYETSREEMKAANEEMQSTNEELRSTMEELETSKEELQSINEELQTVNQENRHKVEELSQLSSDLQNLLTSTDIATLFLDRDLRILRFTPRLSDIFNVRVTDRGRPISDLTHRLGYQNLREDALLVLDRLAPLEREIADDQNHWYLTRILPYRSVEDRIEGVVVTFTDISQRKWAEDAMRESEGNLRGVANVVPDLLWYSEVDGSTPWYNDRWLAYTGQGFDHASGWGWTDVIHPDDRELSSRRYREAVEKAQPLQHEHRIRQHTGEYRWFLIRTEPRLNSSGRVTRMYGSAADIHDQRLAMEALRKSEEELWHTVELNPQISWTASPDGKMNMSSERWASWTGGHGLGEEWHDAQHPDDSPTMYEKWMHSVHTGEPMDVEHRTRIARDGSYRWMRSRAYPRRDANGVIVKWYGTTEDIHEGKLALDALRESEALRRIAVEGGGMGTWRWNLRDGRIWGDPAFLELWAYPPSDQPHQLLAFTERMTPEGQAEMGEMVTRALAAGEEFDGQFAIIEGPTKGRWVRWRGRAQADQPWLVNGVSFDVTSQRLAEERQVFLLKLSDALRDEPDADTIADRALRMLMSHLQLDRCYITYYRPAEDLAAFPYQVGNDTVPPLPAWVRLSDFPEAYRQVLERTFVIDDDFERRGLSEEERANSRQLGMRAMVASTIRKGKKHPVASMAAVSSSPRHWSSAEIGLIEETAERTWAAIERARAEEALRESEARQAFLLRFSDALRLEPEVNSIVDRAVRMLADQLKLDRCYAIVLYPEDDRTDVIGEFLLPGLTPMPKTLRNSDFPEAEAQTHHRTLIFHDTANDPQLTETDKRSLAAMNFGAFLSSPLRHATGNPFWSLGAVSTTARHWTAGEVALMEEATERTWAAVERARAEKALRENEETLAADLVNAERLRSLADRLTTEESFETIYAEVLSAAIAVARADAGTVQLYDPKTKSLELIESKNFSVTITDYFARVDASSLTACGIALKTGQRAFVDFTENDADPGCVLLVDSGIRSAVAVPLVSRSGAPLGMLNAHWREPSYRPTDREVRFLDLIARQATDLIEQRRAQRSLTESERRFRLFVENVREYALVQTDFEGTITSWNPGAERLFGFASVEVLGQPFSMLLPEEDRHSGMIAREMAKLSRGEKVMDAHAVQRKDGTRFWAEWITEPVLDDAGRLRGTAKVMRDETERQDAKETLEKSERRLRSVLEGIPQLVWRSHDTGRWIWASSQWRSFTGQTQGESIEDGWLNAIHPDDRAATVAAWVEADRTGKLDVEHRIRRAIDGVYVWHHTRSLPAPRPEGGTREWLGTCTDVEESKIAAAEKDALLSEVHHRVKNNLQVIVSLLNMQSSLVQDEAVLSQLNEARNRVLAISAIHELLYRGESLTGIVLTDYARKLAPGLVNFYGLGSRVSVTVEGNGSKLELERAVPFGMLLNELVSNACKHAFPVPATGTILIRVEPDDETAVLTVSDNGKGLPKGFEYQKATSLGLKLVHALARQLRGTVEVSSAAHGAAIIVRFPAVIPEARE